MHIRVVLPLVATLYFTSLVAAAPRPKLQTPSAPSHEKEIEENVVDGVKEDHKVDTEMDELGLEYGRYLQEVVKALDEDPEFAKKLENITHDQIMTGHVARHIESVAPDVRNRLDELKRIELQRLRKLAMKEHQLQEEIESEKHDGTNQQQYASLANGRRWRTTRTNNAASPLLDEKNAAHVNHANPHTFEAEDLQRLIMQATKDLEELDRKRRRDFKQYEMEKEIHFRDSIANMTETERAEAEKKHQEELSKHSKHDHINHPGSKHQLEQVWQEQDHMQKQDFDPKIFFQMHDVNGDGFLDPEEVESLLSLEVRKLYNEHDPSFDKNVMHEEYGRMREHVYQQVDANRDGLISRKEFLDYSHSPEFERDEGWKGVEESPVYSEQELKQYQAQRANVQQHYAQYGAYQLPQQQYAEHAEHAQPYYYYQVPAGQGAQGVAQGQQQHIQYVQHPAQGADQGHHQQIQYMQHPAQGGQQPMHYANIQHPSPDHMQAPMQIAHAQMAPQHYAQTQQQPQQYQQQYQQPQQGQHQQVQYIAAAPGLPQQGQHSQSGPQQAYGSQQMTAQYSGGQAAHPQAQQAPQQAPQQAQHQQPPQHQQQQGHYAVPPPQIHQASPPQQPQAVPSAPHH